MEHTRWIVDQKEIKRMIEEQEKKVKDAELEKGKKKNQL